jgi:hypothetical protein
MNTKTLSDLWIDTMAEGYLVRKNGLDGLESWQPLKKKYTGMYIDDYKDGIPVKKKYLSIAKNKYIIGSDKTDHKDSKFKIGDINLDNRIEAHHFYIQHFRIPNLEKNKLSVLKLLQIAYNAGQFKSERKNNPIYCNAFIKFYDKNKLNQIETYIDEDLINEIPTKDITGGSATDDIYYTKYIKYKQKYLSACNVINI